MSFSLNRSNFARMTHLLLQAILFLYFATGACTGVDGLDFHYSRQDGCVGKRATKYALITLNSTTPVGCAVACEERYLCVLFFYSRESRYCSLHSRTVSNLPMEGDVNTNCFQAQNIAESWVMEVLSVSSFVSGYYGDRMLGPEDRFPWVQSASNQDDVIELRFAPEMFIEQILIHEIHSAGGVSEISLLSPDGTWYSVWSTHQLEEVGQRIMAPDLKITNFKSSKVRINVGARATYENINALRVIGKNYKMTRRDKIP